MVVCVQLLRALFVKGRRERFRGVVHLGLVAAASLCCGPSIWVHE